MDLSNFITLLQKLEHNESIWKMYELKENRFDSVAIRALADKEFHDLLKLADNLSPNDIESLGNQGMVKSGVLGMVFVCLGPEKLKNSIPELMEYLQDMNWPAAGYVAKVLKLMPAEILVPRLVRIIEDSFQDDVWIYWLCSTLIDGMDKNYLETLKNPLLNYIKNCPYPEEPIRAAETIIPVLTTEEFQDICSHHETKFATYYPLSEMTEFKEAFINSLRKDL